MAEHSNVSNTWSTASVISNQPLPAPAEGEALDAVDDMPIADEETSTPFTEAPASAPSGRV
jgi:hypothetical protein